MEKIFQQEIFNNTVEAYAIVAGMILLALFFKRIISKYVAKILYNLVTKSDKQSSARQSFLTLVVGPLDTFLVLLIAIAALDRLNFPAVLDFRLFHITFRQFLDSLTYAVIIIVFIWLCVRLIDFIAMVLAEKAKMDEHKSHNQLIVFLKDFLKVILVIIGMLLVLRFSFNKQIGNLLTGLSLVGAAVALAAKESMENLIASFIIFFDKPFITGDLIKINGFTGNIERIGLRSTRIRTAEKTYISVPNKQMVDSIVDNITLRTQRRVELRLELSLSATAAQLKALSEGIKKILQQPGIENSQVYLLDTGKSAHILAVDYFTTIPQPIEAFNMLREQVNLEVIDLLAQSGVELAAASTDVILSRKKT